jgi:hypothetical protein
MTNNSFDKYRQEQYEQRVKEDQQQIRCIGFILFLLFIVCPLTTCGYELYKDSKQIKANEAIIELKKLKEKEVLKGGS